jgi:hypothetical protein
LPLAPARLSITICWPSRSDNCWPMMRAMMSVLLPAGNDTMKRIGWSGQPLVCAQARFAASAEPSAMTARRIILPSPGRAA